MDLINIINEETTNFDFLGNEAEQKIQKINDLLKNVDFQKQFIVDTLIEKPNKIKIVGLDESEITGEWEINNDSKFHLGLKYIIEIDYKYDANNDSINFNLNFDCEYISISQNNELNWNDIDVLITNKEGDNIEFIAFKKAPIKIQSLFIKHYVGYFVEHGMNKN